VASPHVRPPGLREPGRLAAFARRVVAYNRQPRKLVLLPFSLTATLLGLYALWTGDLSTTLMFVVVGLCAFVIVADGVMWFAGHVIAGYREGSGRT
jgi:cell division protein FtsW (lipid II flippase)